MSPERPDALTDLTPEQIVELDVRPILEQGGQPLSHILAAIDTVPEAGALVLQAPFKPAPLFNLLGRQGWSHWIEHGSGTDWKIWFYRE